MVVDGVCERLRKHCIDAEIRQLNMIPKTVCFGHARHLLHRATARGVAD